MKQVSIHNIIHHISERNHPNQNGVEGVIREIRRRWYRIMLNKHIPQRLWDYVIHWICEIMSRTVNSRFDTNSKTPYSIVVGETPDISEYVDFALWDWVHVIEGDGLSEATLAKFLGVSHSIGNAMSYFILKSNGQVLTRSTVQPITNIEMNTDSFKDVSKVYIENILQFYDVQNCNSVQIVHFTYAAQKAKLLNYFATALKY